MWMQRALALLLPLAGCLLTTPEPDAAPLLDAGPADAAPIDAAPVPDAPYVSTLSLSLAIDGTLLLNGCWSIYEAGHHLGVSLGVDGLSLSCPEDDALAGSMGGCRLVLPPPASLPASFAYGKGSVGVDLVCKMTPQSTLVVEEVVAADAASLAIDGTYDVATHLVHGSFSATWNRGGPSQPPGSTSGEFDVEVP
jgi:hypothetical protein